MTAATGEVEDDAKMEGSGDLEMRSCHSHTNTAQ